MIDDAADDSELRSYGHMGNARLAVPVNDGQTHWQGCAQEHGHHACALAELDRLRAELAAWQDASQCGHPNPCTLGPLCPWCEIARLRALLTRVLPCLEQHWPHSPLLAELAALIQEPPA